MLAKGADKGLCKYDNLTDRRHYAQIDALRGIAIFLVILGHGIILYPIDLHQNEACLFLFNWISSVHMELFFVISGFCFSYQGDYKAYLWKKGKRLLLPYFVFNLTDMILRSHFSALVNRPRGIGESLRKMIFNGGEYWFLYTLFLIFLIYPFIYKAVGSSSYKFGGLLVVLLAARYYLPGISVFTLDSVVRYLFYFSIGVMVKQTVGGRIFDIKIPAAVRTILIAALLLLWLTVLQSQLPYRSILSALVGIATMYLVVQFRAVVDIFGRFGKYSLQLYLFNGFFLVASRTVIVSVLGVYDPFIIIVFNVFVDFFVSYVVIKYLCERIKPVRLLMGMQ